MLAFINNGARKKRKGKKKNELETFVEVKSETLISLQSNSIVSSGFNRTQWCKIIRSRSRWGKMFEPRRSYWLVNIIGSAKQKTIPEVGSLKIIRAVMNVIWSKEGAVERADSVARSRSGRESQ